MPSANAGNEMPDTASVMPTRSGQRLRHTADTMPIAMPIRHRPHHAPDGEPERRHEAVADLGRDRAASCAATCRSPSAARRGRSAGTAAAAAGRGPGPCGRARPFPASRPGPAASRAGSPGSRCTNRNTRKPTSSSVGSRPSRRWTMYRNHSAQSFARYARTILCAGDASAPPPWDGPAAAVRQLLREIRALCEVSFGRMRAAWPVITSDRCR